MSRAEQFLLGSGYSPAAIQVGLLNNMPDAQLRATELRFARLLKDACGGLDVRLRLFSLNSIPRSDEARMRMAGFYDDAAFLEAAGLDALIVTGVASDQADLTAQPYWKELAQRIDWAQSGTLSTLFSGLASAAAVRQLDGIAPRPLPAQVLGVYASRRAEDDPLFFNNAPAMPMPHARRHDLAECELRAAGYRILARLESPPGEDGQVDIFTRETPGQSRLVFLQGHPEYDPNALARLYLQEMERFLAGETDRQPSIPQNYFDRATEDRLAAIRSNSGLSAYQALLANALPRQVWHPHMVRLIGNWLTLVAAAKARQTATRAVRTRRRA